MTACAECSKAFVPLVDTRYHINKYYQQAYKPNVLIVLLIGLLIGTVI